MKKRDLTKKGNIILFPDLDQRYLERGLEAVQNKNFQEAVSCFEKAIEINPDNSEIKTGLVLSYYELGMLQESKKMAKSMLEEGQGDYLQVLDLYMMILVQLHEYEEIATTIEVLLEDKHIPAGKIEHFSKLLDFSRKMAALSGTMEEEYAVEDFGESGLDLASIQDQNEMLLLAAKLEKANVRQYIDEVKEYIGNPQANPFFQSMLLNILKEQEYEQQVLVRKMDREMSVVPKTLEDVRLQEQTVEIMAILKEKLEHQNPVLLENIVALLERHFFLLYPFTLDGKSSGSWAAAYHSIVQDYYGMHDEMGEDIGKLYHVSASEIETAKAIIASLEEISYPNM